MNANDLLTVAKEAAFAAGKVTRDKFYQPLRVTNKGFRDYVTDADLAAQDTITGIIRAAFPDHGFFTEEEDSTLPADGPVIWIIDPIDGTTNYSRQIPLFCISIAAVINRLPFGEDNVLAGVIYDPMRDELFSAVLGGESQLNGRPMSVSSMDNLEPATIAADWNRAGHLRQATLETVNRLVHDVDGIACFHTASLALAWVAAGRVDGYFNFSLMPWDVAAASLLIRLSGGCLSDMTGQPLSLSDETLTCLASNGRLHDRLLNYLPDQIGMQTDEDL
jgi:myo-inositol-1(or 4)-monophosphatase